VADDLAIFLFHQFEHHVPGRAQPLD